MMLHRQRLLREQKLRIVAALVPVDERTAKKWHRGEPVKPSVAARLRARAIEQGYQSILPRVDDTSGPDDVMPTADDIDELPEG